MIDVPEGTTCWMAVDGAWVSIPTESVVPILEDRAAIIMLTYPQVTIETLQDLVPFNKENN